MRSEPGSFLQSSVTTSDFDTPFLAFFGWEGSIKRKLCSYVGNLESVYCRVLKVSPSNWIWTIGFTLSLSLFFSLRFDILTIVTLRRFGVVASLLMVNTFERGGVLGITPCISWQFRLKLNCAKGLDGALPSS